MREATKRRVSLFVRTLCSGVVLGIVIGAAARYSVPDSGVFGVVLGALTGAMAALILTAMVAGTEIFLPQTRLGQRLDRAPLLVTIGSKWVVYSAVTVFVIGNRVPRRLAALMLLGPGATWSPETIARTMPASLAIAVTLLFSLSFTLVLHLGRLIGDRTLRDIAFGRYHQPRREERFFLFVDIAGSTPLAERIGADAVHRFLGEVFRLASDPIDDHAGDVYQYVGDEIVVTWPVAAGRERARPIACFFAIQAELERAGADFEREFGVRPRLRAALHAGSVIAGEVGGSRRSIVFHGDVLNTTSRLEQATRDLERQFLASADALEHLDSVGAYALEDLGEQRLRGRVAPLRAWAITAKA